MKLTSRQLEKLKSRLPRGYRMILWSTIGNVSMSTIDAVMRGDFFNQAIIDAAIELAEKTQQAMIERSEKISNL